jgi:microcystin degradation protein MlrC
MTSPARPTILAFPIDLLRPEGTSMRIFIAGLDTETNTFSPIPTSVRGFEDGFLARGDATRRPENYCSAQLHVWRRLAETMGYHVIEGLCSYAEPAGVITRPAYESLREEILEGLRQAMPVDIVLLALHGAMVADGYDDCEGDILTHVRRIAGPAAVIGAELDLHCHITDAMVTQATALVAYKEYPHVDIPERAAELFKLCADAAEGHTRPRMAAFDCRMIGTFRTTEQPLRAFVDKMKAMEGKDGILSVSLGHGFPYGDVKDEGVKTLVIADHDEAKARAVAKELGMEVFAMREAIAPKFLTIDEALDQALAHNGNPVVIADTADNAGGGAPGDSTFFLRRILERGITDVASGYYWDPIAVRFCMDAGVGATLDLRVGGKCGPMSGDPVDLKVTVRGMADMVTQRFGDAPDPMGPSVWISAKGIDLVLTTLRTQVFHPEGMTKLGIDLSRRKIVVVKSTQHFHAGYAPIASRVLYAAAPGTLSKDFAKIPYRHLTRPLWPKVANPFA